MVIKKIDSLYTVWHTMSLHEQESQRVDQGHCGKTLNKVELANSLNLSPHHTSPLPKCHMLSHKIDHMFCLSTAHMCMPTIFLQMILEILHEMKTESVCQCQYGSVGQQCNRTL